MTRETKIGLLVGLAFIIVIGILLSDRFGANGGPPMAVLTNTGNVAHESVSAPGTANPPVTYVAPQEAPPTESVPTRDELTTLPPPVVPSARYTAPAPATPNSDIARGNNPNSPANSQEDRQEDHGADLTIPRQLSNAAQVQGEPLVPAHMDGTPRQPVSPPMVDPAPTTIVNAPVAAASPTSYVAQPGDSVSRMAARLLGKNNSANRKAIIEANASLREDPDRVIVGQTYVIPGRRTQVSTDTSSVSNSDGATPEPAPTTEYIYTVRSNDSLWKIANDVLGDPGQVDAIKELNANVLRGENHDTVIEGMKLKLPSKPPVASAN
jgi:nucleoid-associated protein YgaU